MTAADLIQRARVSVLFDAVQPYLWSDEELLDFLDDATNEAGKRNPLCQRAAIETVTLSAGQVMAELPAKTARVLAVKLSADELTPQSNQVVMASQLYSHGKTGTLQCWSATSRFLLVDIASTLSHDLTLMIQKLPESIVSASQTPEIPDSMQRGLLDWVAYRALSKPDGETQDMNKAENHAAKFAQVFGDPLTAYQQATRMTSRKRTVRSAW